MKSMRSNLFFSLILALSLSLFMSGCKKEAVDEAKAMNKTADDFPEADEDFFKDMDGGVELTTDEVKGRNTWMLYTGGNEAFWNYLATHSFGTVDLLKLLTSYPGAKYSRDNRFEYLGLINEPGFKKADKPNEYGLWLDERIGEPDPFENQTKYPGVHAGESFYGNASGIVGLRLFPNPDFDAAAQKKWDAEKFYNDRNYYYDKKLVRPYRVGMSCGFCHVGPHPLYPPADKENPEWKNLSTNVGAQYFWVGRVFGHELDKDNFVWQLFNSSPPGALETSMIATDNINNPRTMNAIYNVGARLKAAERYPKETVAGGTLALSSIDPTMPEQHVPHILKDGADAVGVLGALTRVYFNIGSFHQEWIEHFNPIVGGKPQTPIKVEVAKKNSVYFQVTEGRVGNLAKFFVKAANPHHLKDAEGGDKYLTKNEALLTRGKLVFADNCARCHSSKQPESGPMMASKDIIPSESYRDLMRNEVLKPDFIEDNYLSDEDRHPVTEIGTNAAAALASNAIKGHVWDNFSSETYKNLPAVGTIQVQNPVTGAPFEFKMPGGGRGYYRTPSLISIWSSAPFFHNNSLGNFTNDPSVDGRMQAFNDAIEKLLWPEKRGDSDCNETWGLPFCPPIYRTTQESYIILNKAFLPKLLHGLLDDDQDEVRIGPIPKGTPIDLLSNIDLEIKFGLSQVKKHKDLLELLIHVKKTLRKIKNENLSTEEGTELMKQLVPDLLDVSKCPDFVIDRGHTFGSQLPDADKWALIEFLKTF